MKRHLVWFRNDLRISDNPALYHACLSKQHAIAIYIATPEQWQRHNDASVKIDFWRRNLLELQRALAELNIELRIFNLANYQAISSLMISLCQLWQVDAVYFNNEYPVNERHRDDLLETNLQQHHIVVKRFNDQLLFEPQTIRNKIGAAFKVFTPFAKHARQQLTSVLSIYPAPASQQKIECDPHPQQCHLNQVNWPELESDIASFWPAGEDHAHSQLFKFCHSKLSDYHLSRDTPSLRATSKLSTYLNSGVISVRQCWQASQTYCEANQGVFIWQNELLWREFYKHVLIDFPYVSMHKPWKRHTDAIAWRDDEDDLLAWQLGRTGFPLVDAAMRQLLHCGWMHNRLRMVTAMFLTKHLLIDWRLGEQWFMQHLIDGELSANNGGWQWSASTGVDAVPYFRIFNPVTQSQRFDPQGEFIKQYLPQLVGLSDKDIHQPKANQREGYYPAIIDLKVGRQRALTAFKSAQA